MKTKYLLPMLCLLVYLFVSCDDNQQQLFSGETSIHFALSGNELDSISRSFLNTSDNQIVVELPVELDGYAKQDYNFRLKINEEQTTAVVGKHYDALAELYQIKKGEYSVRVPVTMNYTLDLDTVAVKLVVDLETDDPLVAGIPYRQQAVIVCSNLLPTIAANLWKNFYASYFGTYSKVKHRYILSELKLNTIIDFENWNDWYYNIKTEQKKAYGQYMNNFFADHEIYDEYNQRIEPWMN